MDIFVQELFYVIGGLGLIAAIGFAAIQWIKWKERESWRIHDEYIRSEPQKF